MNPTNKKCRFLLKGIQYEKRIYVDAEGDWFIEHDGRYYDYLNFTFGLICYEWEE